MYNPSPSTEFQSSFQQHVQLLVQIPKPFRVSLILHPPDVPPDTSQTLEVQDLICIYFPFEPERCPVCQSAAETVRMAGEL